MSLAEDLTPPQRHEPMRIAGRKVGRVIPRCGGVIREARGGTDGDEREHDECR